MSENQNENPEVQDDRTPHEKHSRRFTPDELSEGGHAVIRLVDAASGGDMQSVLTATSQMVQALMLGMWGCFIHTEYVQFEALRETIDLEAVAFPENVIEENVQKFREVYDEQMPVLARILG